MARGAERPEREGHAEEPSLFSPGTRRFGRGLERVLPWVLIAFYAAVVAAYWAVLGHRGAVSGVAVTALVLRRMLPAVVLAVYGRSARVVHTGRHTMRWFYIYAASFAVILVAWAVAERHNVVGGVAAALGLAGALLTLFFTGATDARRRGGAGGGGPDGATDEV